MMRWLVRFEPVLQPRFGMSRRDVMGWTVRPYFTLASGERAFMAPPTPFKGLTAALVFARRECARYEAARAGDL